MRHGLWGYLVWGGLLAVSGCNPYKNLDGDFYLGPVDARNYQPPYLGLGFDETTSVGTIVPSVATVSGGGQVGYYAFPAGADPTFIDFAEGGGTALVYVFDGDSSHDSTNCKPPSSDYGYDVKRDRFPLDRHWNVFEDLSPAAPLPDDPSYVPVYAQVPVTPKGVDCQSIHSAEGLVVNSNVTAPLGPKPLDESAHQVGIPDGTYLAMAMVDPRAIVLKPDGSIDPVTGAGGGRYGFFNHMLVAYVEGGAIPTVTAAVPDPNGGPDVDVILARTATLYVPNVILDAMGDPACAGLDCLGQGFDLLEGAGGGSGARGDSGYSPICSVRTFTPADPAAPESDPGQVDPASLDPDDGTFVYCLQTAE
jgi:hypothetical protein